MGLKKNRVVARLQVVPPLTRNRAFIQIILAFGILLLASCGGDKTGNSEGLNEVEETRTAANPLLKLLSPEQTGVDFQNIILESDEDNFTTNVNKYNGGGLAVGDFNNDGFQDIYFVCTNGKNKLYLNQGGLKFKDVTDASGAASDEGGFETTATLVDINADGWLDIYICRAGVVGDSTRRNKLYINNGIGSAGVLTFSEKAAEYGLDDISASTGANFFDSDNDGDLDLYLLNHPSEVDCSNKFETVIGPDGKTPMAVLTPRYDTDSDRLYRNDGGKFTDISKASGIWNLGYGLSVSVSDLNRDGWPDVYVGNDFIHPDFYYENNPGKPGQFTERLKESFRHTSRHTMGSDLTDFDNDCLVDLFAVDMLPMNNYRVKTTKVTMTQSLYTTSVQNGYYEPVARNVLQRNNGNGTFSDIGCMAGVFATEWSWSGLLFDMDNDGLRDIHVTNGYRRNINDNDFFEFQYPDIQKASGNNLKQYFKHIDNFLKLIPTYKSRNCCYRNDGDWTFSDKGGDWLTLPASWSCGSAWADFDNDGDLDLVVNNLDEPSFIYQNFSREQGKGNYLQLKLQGSAQNPLAVGASVLIEYGGQRQYQELNPTRGIFSSVEHLLHFGLGNATQIDKITLRWPDGKTQTLTNITANQRLALKYADASGYVKHLFDVLPQTKYFSEKTASSGIDFLHEENFFNDFEIWPLSLMSETDLGPFTAKGDVNGDGLDDFFIGNTFDKPAALFVQTPGGRFKKTNAQLWEQDKLYEDHGAVFFDADGDGDSDLYVVSGGMEAVSELAWQNRLYLNDGKGNFSKAADALPVIKDVGLRVRAHDFDKDGDLDIFVGGRVSGGKWPLAPRSFILQNDGKGKFSDATAQVAPDFEHCGMVTDMLFADLDGDGLAELAVCGEWLPVTVFQFSGGKYVNATEKFGLSKSDGLWNSLAAADLDGDGDMDLVSGNLGLNSRLPASAEFPLRVYAKDFDGNGTVDPIVTFAEEGKNFPLVQKWVLQKQIPSLKKKLLYYRDYSRATVEQVYPQKDLDAALNLFAYTLETCWWENQGGRFVRRKLPNPAQTSPANAILVEDFTGDGRIDILLAGNKYGMEVETNRLDAGNGVLLQGDGKGNFQFVENHVSGFWATKEVRDMALLRGAGGKKIVLVSNNHGKPQIFEGQ